MKLIGYLKNGKGVVNDVETGTTGTISIVKELDDLDVVEVTLTDAPAKRSYNKKPKPEPETPVTD